MKKITEEIFFALTGALKEKEYLSEFVKIESDERGDWIELYFNAGFGDLRVAEFNEICTDQGLAYCLLPHPTHIKFLVWPYTPSN